MKKLIPLLLPLVASIFLLTSCDPGLSGDLKVFNQSNEELMIIAFEYGSQDSLIYYTDPGEERVIKILGGLGDKSQLDCCPCQYERLYIKTSDGKIKKDAYLPENWVIPNKAELERFGEEPVKCELHIAQSDL